MVQGPLQKKMIVIANNRKNSNNQAMRKRSWYPRAIQKRPIKAISVAQGAGRPTVLGLGVDGLGLAGFGI